MTYFGVDLITAIEAIGYIGLFGIVFAETGLLIGFFLPGDSLLFVAGFLSSQGIFHPAILIALLFTAAVVGDSVGYAIGKKAGKALFTKEDSLFFKKAYIEKTQRFYEIHGGKTLILARFIPILRTFAPTLAGVGNMKYSVFLFYNVIGGALWVFSLILLGYFLGKSVPNIDAYLLPIVLGIIILSLLPGVLHFFSEWRKEKKGKQ
jgi:membrane-associated protein